jgi:outer membrane protein assembly factor BamD (BamD/ComL family)
MNMQKTYRLILTVIPIIMLVGCASTRKHWEETKSLNTIGAYENFITKHPNTVYTDSAKTIIHKLNLDNDWTSTKQNNTFFSYEKFLQKYQESKYTDEARLKLSELYEKRDLDNSQTSEDIYDYEKFMKKYPDSKYQNLVKEKLNYLKDWCNVKKIGTIQAYQNFIKNHTNNPYVENAKTRMDDYNNDISGREIVEALRNYKVEVEVTGSSIKNVKLRIRRKTNHTLKITLPIGTYFVCRGSSQNMVGRQEVTITLDSDEWQTYMIPVACSNRTRNIPNADDNFNILSSPNQSVLKLLMPVLEKSNVSFEVEQAAVWIVTDDADYHDLGSLIQFPMGARAIQEYEAAMAIKICEEAGITVKSHAIWYDVPNIIRDLKDNNLKGWFVQKYGSMSIENTRPRGPGI